jgi:hypothetical protein
LALQPARRNIQSVNELTRLAYLDAMGIDSYVSRAALIGAAPSRRMRLVQTASVSPAEEPVPQVAVAKIAGAAADLRASLGDSTARATARVASPETVAPVAAAEAAEMPIFSLAAVSLGGWYWLDDIPPGRGLGPEYLQLLQAIAVALGMQAGPPVLEQFNWPMHTSTQLDRDDAAARGGLGGFLANRLERIQPAGVILLGEFAQAWFDRDLLSPLPIVDTVSGWQMLRQPALKRQAWSDLQVLRESST